MIQQPQDTERDVTCYIWNINQRYFHEESSQIRVKLDYDLNSCGGNGATIPTLWWLDALIIILSLVSFCVELNHTLEQFRIVARLR